MNLKIPTTILMLLVSLGISAQNPVLSGRVTDKSGNPLAGVFVSVKGAQANGALTDLDGNYSIAVPANAETLVFSMLSFETQEVTIGQQTVYNVTLDEASFMLDETVVVGYGTISRKELTASVASVKNEELTERASALNVGQSIAGKLAGVQAFSTSGRPGGGMNITVRGYGSINASNDPLYIVDGVVDVDPSMINSSDIEKIDVLKDAAGTAMYGAKGSNGVIMITTKAGTQSSGTVTFETKTGVSTLARRLNTVDTDTYLKWIAESYAYDGEYSPHLVNPNEKLFDYQMNADGTYARDTNGCLIATPKYNVDWQDEVFRVGLVTDNTLSFTQGNDKVKIYTSLGFQNVDGILKTTYSRKYTGTVKADAKITNWLDFHGSISASRDKTNANDNEGTMMNGALRMIYEMAPILPVYYPDGTPSRINDYFTDGEPKDNPINQLNSIYNVTENTNVLANIGLDWHLAKGLTLTTNGSFYLKDIKNNYFVKKGIFNWATNESVASVTNTSIKRWTNEDYLTYSDSFFGDKLKSTFTLGASWYYYLNENSTAAANSISSEIFSYHNLGAGTTIVAPSSGYDLQTMNSFYFRTNQVLFDRYILGIILRCDGASVFGANHKYGFFPSASLGWLMSEEPWFKPAKDVVNLFKVRLSYGLTGNSSISSYKSLATFSAGTAYFNNNAESTQVLGQLANGDLTWESAGQFDAGLDINFLNDRIQIITDFYIKNTYNLLYDLPVPYTTGYSSSLANCAQLRNTGFEFTIKSYNIDKKDFKWRTDFIFSTNKTIVADLGGAECIDGGTTISTVGEEWARWYVPHRIGIWQIDEADQAAVYGAKPGDIKYKDVDGDGVFEPSTDDREFVGGTNRPKYELSMVNSFYFKGFNLMIDLGSLLGYKLLSYSMWLTEQNKGRTSTTMNVVNNSWSVENPNTRIPAVIGQSSNYANISSDDYFLCNGDFLRIRNISLTYDFKDRLLKNSKFFKGLVFGVNAENVYVFTKYSGGFDPECGWGNPGADWLSYPRPLVVTANLKLSF